MPGRYPAFLTMGQTMRAILYTAVLAGSIALAGCCGSLRSWISDSKKAGQVAVPELAPASVEAARRVDKIGRQLTAANAAMGMEITFQTVGMSEPEIYHRDAHGVFITEALVNQCKTDDQLAAVLATELGNMVSEARTRERMRLPDPIPAVASGPKLDGSTDYDPGRDMELARYDRQFRKPSEKANWPTTNPKSLAGTLLKDANFDPESLTAVAPLLREAKRNHTLSKQFGGTPDSPHWSN
jgi:hypothetical protein